MVLGEGVVDRVVISPSMFGTTTFVSCAGVGLGAAVGDGAGIGTTVGDADSPLLSKEGAEFSSGEFCGLLPCF